MCGASLVESEELEQSEEEKRTLPHWVGSLVVLVLALTILGAGGYGLYTMLADEPEPEPTPMITPSPTLTPRPSAVPTDTPPPTATPTPIPPLAHDVQEGETVSDIADLYDVTIDQILALNPDVDPELIRAGQVLLIPGRTPAMGAAALEDGDSAGTNGFVVHVVSSGETLSSIAAEYDVSLSVIRAANDLSPDDETIRPEQSLVIPMSTPTPSPTPTADPNATPTMEPPYLSPPLLYPSHGTVFTDDAPVLLQWASVGVLQDNEWYELSLWRPGSGLTSSTVRTRATAWRVPLDVLEGVGPGTSRFLWRVQVVREAPGGAYEEAGASSSVRAFVWRGPSPTGLPPATSTP